MKAFTFAEISLRKKCFRVIRVIARDEHEARHTIPEGDWAWGLLGEQETRSRKRSYKTHLIWTREEWSEFVKPFGLTAETAETRIGEATRRAYDRSTWMTL